MKEKTFITATWSIACIGIIIAIISMFRSFDTKVINYKGHNYILFQKNFPRTTGAVHDPDCPCHHK